MADSDEYDTATSGFDAFGQRLVVLIEDLLNAASISVNQVTYRVKKRKSAYDKVRDNPDKYSSVRDLTDLLGVRIITYFPDQVDAVAEIITTEFNVEASRSTDKRAVLEADQFGYLSVHYLATLNKIRAALTEYSQFAAIYIEFQIRSLLQHTWAEIEHDLGYKSEVAVPRELRRRFSRLAGLLEIADTEFQAIYDERADYTTRVSAQIQVGLGNLLLDQISVVAYIEQNQTVRDLDEKLALILRSDLDPEDDVSVYYADDIARATLALGIGTIEELDELLRANIDLIVEFAKRWAEYGAGKGVPTPTEIPHGISLFYLAIVASIEIFDENSEDLEDWTASELKLDRSVAYEFRETYRKATE